MLLALVDHQFFGRMNVPHQCLGMFQRREFVVGASLDQDRGLQSFAPRADIEALAEAVELGFILVAAHQHEAHLEGRRG